MASELAAKMAGENRQTMKQRFGLNHALEEIERKTCDEGLPCNVGMEREAIFALLTGEAKFAAILFSALNPEDFKVPAYATIFASLRTAWEQGVPFDTPATLIQWIRDGGLARGMSQSLGEIDPQYKSDRRPVEDVFKIMQSEGLATNAEYYAITLRRLKMERDIWLLLIDAIRDARRSRPVEWLVKYRDKIAAMVPPEM